ncbi:hypothetical protein [Litoribrevibacter albus]|uniref:hypothetical protein n=1 Tax=Litoribrevibacter albus TaxID=1473156 RepID=UPI0024E0A2A1|nr:hypothetical protein [Litoribrevibacter albus]
MHLFVRHKWLRPLVTSLLLLVSGIAASDEKLTPIYFYDPEITISRNSTLKQKLDQFLVQRGNYQFQPVTDRDIFSSLTATETDSVFMMSSWLFDSLINKAELTAQLVGIKNNTPYYKKLLVIHKDHLSTPPSELIVASTGSSAYSNSVLDNILNKTGLSRYKDITRSKLLSVPKDLDALLSVGFGMAQAALSTEDSLLQLQRLYQNQHQQLEVLGLSAPLMRILVVTPKQSSPETARLIHVIEQMGQSQTGKISLSLIGLDSWMQVKDAVSLAPSNKLKEKQQGGKKP